ncbi:molecular chaperone TorD family protein [uncultured Campylobacter sp.]|uniref:molecular chaperone TorD family protein n=1 Tax=uncultured Campylobacter sp. TaxID=218934 RepID=UPI00261B3CA6|nr:molecular chaperone TorD family protein [uncultured Campylobacter sp.]
MDANLIKARSYYYEFFAIPFFFYNTDAKFKRWQQQLEFLKGSPIAPADAAEFENLQKFSFEEFKSEQNSVLFDFSYANVPMSASFYDEGRDDGRMRVAVIDVLKKSKFRRNMELCKECEDYVGFIFYLHSTLLRSEAEEGAQALSTELFTNVTNGFVDEFGEFLCGHVKADFFRSLGGLMKSFFALERSLLALNAPKKDISIAKEAIKKGGYQNKFTNPEDIFDLD